MFGAPAVERHWAALLDAKLPSDSTLRRARVLVDAALCSHMATVFHQLIADKGVLYLWCDSSPQGKRDWFLSLLVYASGSDLLAASTAATQLYQSVEEFSSARLQGDFDRMDAIAQQRHEAGIILDTTLRKHHQIPIALGSGRSGALQKFRAIVRKVLAESADSHHCKALLASIHTITTDFGAEATLTELQVTPEAAVESWLGKASGESFAIDVEEFEGEELIGDVYAFPHATLVPGILHICDNIDGDLAKHLDSFEEWLQGLKVLIALLHHTHLRDRLLGTCVAGRFEQFRQRLSHGVPALASWRWGSIVSALTALLPNKAALQIVWCPLRFQELAVGGPDDAIEQINGSGKAINDVQMGGQKVPIRLELLTHAIRSESWWLYARMILCLHSYTHSLASWAEGCHCHFWLHDKEQSKVLDECRLRLGLQLGRGDGTHRWLCPLAGCRAAELATGKLQEHVEAMLHSQAEELLSHAGCVPQAEINKACTK